MAAGPWLVGGAVGLLAVGVALLYAPVLAFLARTWRTNDVYSHGALVPLIALYLVWVRRDRLAGLPLAPAGTAGAAVMVTAVALLLLGRLAAVMLLQEISLLVLIVGLVCWLLGPSHLRVLALPVAYLVFMMPVFGEGTDWIHWPFQLLAANIGIGLLQGLGFPAFREAQFIHLPLVTLEVADACSGVRYLISVVAVGVPLAYLTQRTWRRRVSLVAVGVVIAIVFNGLRVALIGVWVYYGGEIVHGPFHVLQAMFVAWIGFVALFATAWALGRERGAPAFRPPPRAPGAAVLPAARRRWTVAWGLALAAVVGTWTVIALRPVTPVFPGAELRALPDTLGAWRGEAADVEAATLRVPGADEELARVYHDPAGRSVRLYVAYFASQSQDRDLVNHRSKDLHQDAVEIEVAGDEGRTYRLNRAVRQEGRHPQVVIFWYDLNGRILANRYLAKVTTAFDGLWYGRTNGALVSVSFSAEPADSLDEMAVVREFFPSIRRHLAS
ncbi:MAG TPA: exosortase W [Methylomirabilota bacterium]|nr:exosortase W [Methylomirabilota bacterium]